MLGKRPRPLMRRTTSMMEFSSDDILDAMITESGITNGSQPSDADKPPNEWMARSHASSSSTSFLSPRPHNFRVVVETAAFLKACGLCKRRLRAERDTYIYRGEVAFCSLECRQQLMNQEERNEKCTLSSIIAEPPSSTAGSEASTSGSETMAAA